MEIDSKLKFITAILVIIATIGGFFAVSNHYQLNIGGTVNNIFNNFQSSDSSQANPPAAPTTTLTAPPKPASASDVGSSDQNTATAPPDPPPESTQPTATAVQQPTSIPTPTPTPVTKLSFGETVSGTITPAIRLNRYSIELPQAGRLTITVAKGSPIAPSYLTMRLLDSDKTLEKVSNAVLGGSTNTRIDLEAGTYYIQVEEYDFDPRFFNPSLSNGAYTLTVKFVPF